jgi:radical SAM protein with 4Fe4S-binding SPASM domain
MDIQDDHVMLLPRREDLVVETRGISHLYLNPTEGYWMRVNESGKRILDLCTGELPVSAIVTRLSTDYGFRPEVLSKSVKRFLARAHDRGLIVTREEFETPKEDASAKPVRLVLRLAITNRCNLACRTCYANAGGDGGRDPDEMTVDEYTALLEGPLASRARQITITGGEPTVRPDLLDLLRTIRARHPETAIVLASNGQVQDATLWTEIASLVNFVQISLDGPRAEINDAVRGEGSFDKAYRTLHILAQSEAPFVAISFTPTNDNVHSLPGMLVLARELGVNTVHVTGFCRSQRPASHGIDLDFGKLGEAIMASYEALWRMRAFAANTPEGERKRQLKFEPYMDQTAKTFRGVKRMYCGAVSGEITIAPHGDVYPCGEFIRPDWCGGNVRREPLDDIYGRMRESMLSKFCVDNVEGCNACKLRHICGGGCRAAAFFAEGSTLKKDPHCKYYHEQIDEKMWNLNL